MKKNFYRLFSLFSILLLLIPIVVNGENLTFGQIQEDLAKAQAELDANNAAINNKENQIDYNNSTITSLRNQITEMGNEVEALQQEIVDANTEISKKQEQTKELLVYLQLSNGENTYLEYAFGAETMTDFIYRMSVVEQITEYNDKMIDDLEKLIGDNEQRKIDLSKKQDSYENKMSDLSNEIGKLSNDIEKLGESAPSLKQQVDSKKELVEYYKSQGCSKSSDVIGRDCAVASASGTFRRPIRSGYVTSWVGYRSGSLHRGIDLGSSTGSSTPLYSIGNGVITSIYHDSYGALCLIIQYRTSSGQYYSALYAHLSRYGNDLYVGKNVTSDTIVGYMGNTGYSFGVHLHLEVWPCRLYGDTNCSNWNKYVNFVSQQYNSGFKGAQSVISFPGSTYSTWYTR